VSRIADAFADHERPVFIGFIVAGDPDPDTSFEVAKALIDAGVGIIELGIPFSDPGADGPTIQQAHERALRAGMRTDGVFALVRRIRAYSEVPIVLFTYYNPVYRRGVDRFFAEAGDAGADGVLCVDLPLEESDEACISAERSGIDLIFLVAPTTSGSRKAAILSRASGFVYLISREGVTGVREQLPEGIRDLITSVRRQSRLPVAVGFGISTPEQVRAIGAAGADAVIVGSAIVQLVGKQPGGREEMLEALRRYVAGMVQG